MFLKLWGLFLPDIHFLSRICILKHVLVLVYETPAVLFETYFPSEACCKLRYKFSFVDSFFSRNEFKNHYALTDIIIYNFIILIGEYS